MWEVKKNRGLSGDPEAQVIAGYQKVLADPTTQVGALPHLPRRLIRPRRQYGRLRHKSRLPTILISQAGAQFDISVAVDVEYLLVDHLFSVNLHDGVNLREDVETMARLATCLQDTSHELHAYYTDLLDNPGGHASPEFLTGLHLPNPELTVPIKLVFLERLSRATSMPVDGNRPSDKAANARYALFLATLLNDSASKEVVVKFSETYNADAHKTLAEIGLAPALHYSEPITGGLVMTVMDRIYGRTAYQLSLLPNGETCPLPRFVYDDVERAILKLREKTLVFGDLRLPNIMRRHVKVHAMLIDFDWAGPDGVARYPSTKSTGPEWSTDARACGLMREAHDSWCLKVIQRACLSA
ncbi:hypothetical protein C8R43DRAFT_872508 [Mycena crocata]|nr:hypothetical protein C8R43DRAFT_909933 [Mycena crocata]KAJ7177557.1 hypothetical protein C8R43DRAFT_872508 [Mycena crocata]